MKPTTSVICFNGKIVICFYYCSSSFDYFYMKFSNYNLLVWNFTSPLHDEMRLNQDQISK